jgi:RNA:NAD 2'-phosphotransferase (TPT1/KptA family)
MTSKPEKIKKEKKVVSKEVEHSKAISYLLRHGAVKKIKQLKKKDQRRFEN